MMNVLNRDKLLRNADVTEFQHSCLNAAFLKFYYIYNDINCKYKLSLGQMLNDVFESMCHMIENIRGMLNLCHSNCIALNTTFQILRFKVRLLIIINIIFPPYR